MSAWVVRYWDLLSFGALFVLHLVAWLEIKNKLNDDANANQFLGPEERTLGATAMSSASSTGITAVSILIPASLLAAMSTSAGLSPSVLTNLKWASAWLLLSLVCGLCIAYLIPLKCFKSNPARHFGIGLLIGPQLFALFIGVVRVVLALRGFNGAPNGQ